MRISLYGCAMVDTLTPKARSERMARIRGKDTVPEMVVRRLVHALGHRFRLHRKDLPGSPDIVFPSRRKIVFVHGCFWHGHDCRYGRLPKSNVPFWQEKIAKNRARDARNVSELLESGWSVLVLWQCQTKDRAGLKKLLTRFLGQRPTRRSTGVARSARLRVGRIKKNDRKTHRDRPVRRSRRYEPRL
jgi:DNA mismatch endonuclease (patch repair protein)